MPNPQPRHASLKRKAASTTTRTVKFWVAPVVSAMAFLSALAALYLGGILNPMTSLRNFPVAVVNQDAGPTGNRIVDGLTSGLDKTKFDVRVVSQAQALQDMGNARIYGMATIPPNFSSSLRDYAQSAVLPTHADRPMIAIATNPRAGTLAASIAGQTLSQAMGVANAKIGEYLSAQVAQQTGGSTLPGAASLALTMPIDIKTAAYNPLPNGAGNGLSAFYYALLLLLGGFSGSIVVSMLVDSMLGYVPAEFGPVYRFAEKADISRFRTLLIKWALMVLLGVLTSAVYMAIAHGLGMPIPDTWRLWLYGLFAISAVGITSCSLMALLGSVGMLVSMLIFVILGLPSAGATVPLEATPTFFRWLAEFEPMHQVFLGVRALLYLDSHADAGFSQAILMTSLGLVIGLLVGGISTRLYDRSGFHRIEGAVELAIADFHQTQHQAQHQAHENKHESSSAQT